MSTLLKTKLKDIKYDVQELNELCIAILEHKPFSYTRLEYIESTGTQYIDTGVVPKEMVDGFRVYVDMDTTNDGRIGCIKYSNSNNENNWCLCPNFGSKTIQFGVARNRKNF